MDELRRRVDEINWFHAIDLGDGIVTPGWDDTPARLARMQIPDDLTGMTVLDVGAWDGFFSFEAERRGAARVLAIDSFSWEGDGWGSKAGFELAHEALGSRVESRTIDVLDLSPETVGVFDLVLFLGVLYHLRYPLLALDLLARRTSRLLALQTLTLPGRGTADTPVDLPFEQRSRLADSHWPRAAFVEGSLAGDPTNWWVPDEACVEAMVRSAGFEVIGQPGHELWICQPAAGTPGWCEELDAARSANFA